VLTGVSVLVRIVANPIANVFQKRLTQRSADPLIVIGATHALLTLAVLPFAIRAPWTSLATGFWRDIAACGVLAVAGNVLLVAALRSTDLSILGPINAYKAVVSLGLGVILLGEVPSMWGGVGILLTVAGSALIVDRAPGQGRRSAFASFLRDPGVRLRFGALVCSATEAVFLKRAILQSSPTIVFYGWVMLGLPLAALASFVLLRRECAAQVRHAWRDWRTYAWLSLATGIMQLTTLLAFGSLQVSYSLALFQLSTLVSVVLGAHVFAEQNIRRRLIGSAVMIAGAALIVTLGRRGA
jgi:drug/metabolite transporter (DMT)-like permease